MAINFPSTAGQATDGSYTYNVAGIVYSWNGSSWDAAGSGASATDRTLFSVATASPATAALSYNNTNGIFTYTPPDLSGYLTAEADTLADVTGRGATTNDDITLGDASNQPEINLSVGVSSGSVNYLKVFGGSNEVYFRNVDGSGGGGSINIQSRTGVGLWQGTGNLGLYIDSDCAANLYYQTALKLKTTTTGVTITGALTAGGLTYPTTNGTSGDVLTSDGAGNVTWTTPSGLQTRKTISASGSVVNNGVLNTTFTTPKTYALLKIETSHAAWVTLYSSSTARNNDAARAETTDPTPGSGVLAEVITSGAVTQLITPGTICFNESASNTTYAKIVNKSGSTTNISVTLTFVQLEV